MSEVKYPDVYVQLTGENGNIFNLLGITRRAMRDAGLPDSAFKELADEVKKQESYDMALATIMKYVDAG